MSAMMLGRTGFRGLLAQTERDSLYDQTLTPAYARLDVMSHIVGQLPYGKPAFNDELAALLARTNDLDTRLTNLDDKDVGQWRADMVLLTRDLDVLAAKLDSAEKKQMLVVIGGSGALIGAASAFIARMRRSKSPILIGTLAGVATSLTVFGLNRAFSAK